MKKLLFLFLSIFVLNGLHSQSILTCLSPTLVFTDPLNGNATVPSTVNCDFPGLVRIQTNPSLNGAGTPTITQGNTPCIRIQTSLTNANASTNNSMALFQGTVNYATICGTCAISVSNNSLYTLYMPGLTPSMSHSIALCNSAVAPNMTYSVYSCYSNVILNSGTWNNSVANSCQTISIPANTAIGSASFVISPTVSAAAINQNFGSGYITLDPWQMAPGVYSITYNFDSQNGCTTSATRTLQIKNPFVTSNFTPPAALCPYSNCVNLLGTVTGYTSTNGFPFFSGTGVSSNTFCPSTSGAGTFPVTYEIGPTAICGSTITNNVTVNSLPAASAGPTASFTCNNPFTATLSGSGGGTYNWPGPNIISGANSANPVVSAIGNYTVVVTSAANCTAQAVTSVVQNTTGPNVSPNAVSNLITCTNPQATVSVGALSGVTYAWSGPGIIGSTTGAAITVTAGGNYNVVVTDNVNGCSTNSVNITATQNTTITNTPSTAGSVGCVSSPITLSTTASGPYSYTWTAPSGSSFTSGFSSQTATANSTTGGNFTITVKNGINGCVSTSVIAINLNQTPPGANATNAGVVNCTNTAVNLNSSSAGVTYTWVAPSGSSITSGGNTNAAVGNGGGTYTLLVTSAANSCTNSAVTAITTQTAKPTANITNNPIISCTNTMVTINGSPGAGVTYTWTGGTISGLNSNVNVNVTSAGVYSLAVTSTSNGCTSLTPATVNITQDNSTPTLSAASQTAASGCGSASVVTLSGNATPAGSTYTWTSAGGFASGVNNSTVSVNSATTYTLNSTHPVSGCISSLVYTVAASVNQPNVTASSTTGTVTCSNTVQSTTVTSNPSTGVTYAWSGPGIVGASNTAVLTASLAGTYNLVLTNTVNSCSTNSLTFVVSANNSPVVPNASVSNTVNCISSSATISTASSGSGPFSYSWNTGPTSSVIVVSPSSNTNYVVTVTNTANGCTGSQTVSVLASTNPPTGVSVSPNTATLSCASPNATLTASSTGGTSYSWTPPSGGAVSNATGISTQISGPGIYTLVATGANGCSASAITATITPNVNAPTFTVSNASPSITCNNAAPGVSVTVTSTVPISGYTWTPTSGISGSANNNVVTFTASGIYTGVITATNGCSSTTTISVSNATAAPGIVAGTGTAQALSCTNSVVTIAPSFVPSANLTYTWSGPGISGSNSGASINVNQSGSYSLSITNTLTGCVSSSPIVIPVSGSNMVPTLTLSSSSAIGIGCLPSTSTISLNAQSNSSNLTYTWSTGANTSSLSTSTPGVYSLSVTDINSGCVASSTIAVQNNTISPNLTASSAGSLPCGGGTTSLSAITTNTNVSYSWMGAGIVSGSNTAFPSVNQAGTYTVTVLDNLTGCSSTRTLSIVQSTVVALAVADATTGPAPLTVNFSNQSLGAATYSWSFGDGNSSSQFNPSNTYLASGTYTVLLVATNGACSSSDTLIIKVMESLGVIPEVFTPNGDGHNDVFVIQGLDSYPNNNFQVFNRWGSPVYSAKPYKNDWDGSPNQQGKTGSGKLPTGTYFYLLELGDTNKSIYKGFIQIQY